MGASVSRAGRDAHHHRRGRSSHLCAWWLSVAENNHQFEPLNAVNMINPIASKFKESTLLLSFVVVLTRSSLPCWPYQPEKRLSATDSNVFRSFLTSSSDSRLRIPDRKICAVAVGGVTHVPSSHDAYRRTQLPYQTWMGGQRQRSACWVDCPAYRPQPKARLKGPWQGSR
jgi:hypothetical protein